MEKQCTVCGQLKILDEFSKNPKTADGYLHQCKTCVLERVRKWKSENKELIKLRRKITYLKNRSKNIQDSIEWGKNNKEKRKIAKDKWRDKNKELTNHYAKQYSYRKKCAIGKHSLIEYKEKMKLFSGMCAYCKIRKANTKDHIIPLSKGGSDYIHNIVPACVSCNSSKRDKTLEEWHNYKALKTKPN